MRIIGDCRGNWDDINIIILELFKYHKNKFVQALIEFDVFFTYDSVNKDVLLDILYSDKDIKISMSFKKMG